MSWKLAELRWRHDVGLNEKCPDTEQAAAEDDHGESMRRSEHRQRQRGRSYPAPWGRAVEQGELSEDSLLMEIRSHPKMLALSSGPSESSLTPLLKRTQSGMNIVADTYGPPSFSEQVVKQWELSLSHLQSPPESTSFPCDAFDGVRDTLLSHEACPVSFDVPTPSQAFSGKNRDRQALELPRTPQRPSSATTSDAPPLPRTPSFGLHFSQHNGINEERKLPNLNSSEKRNFWTHSQSFSPAFRRGSLDSTHHSDSALLQNISMDIQTSYSSPDRRATRPLYPDLSSAYARIQGRRTASLQQPSSSRSGTRFPLSPSSSSSDDEAPVTISLSNDDIPLRDIPCRNVRSAHIVLHEADHHPESSAIFETSDENTEPSRKRSRASTTLEDIVSQYADASPSNSSLLNGRACVEEPHGMKRPVTGNGQILNLGADPFRAEPVRPSTSHSSHELYHLYEQEKEDITFPARPGQETIDEEEEWETVAESSRSGFLTPSKLRFRLRKGKSDDTSTPGVAGRSPTSPWDPLSNSTQSNQVNPRPPFRHKDPLNYSCNQPLADELRHRDDSTAGKRIDARHPRSTDMQEKNQDNEGQRHRSETARTHIPVPVRPLNINPRYDKRIAPIHINSSPRPERSSAFSTTHALASSSLLPKPLDNMFLSSVSSPLPMKTSPGTSSGNPTFGLSSLGEGELNTSVDRNSDSAVANPTPDVVYNTRDSDCGYVEGAGSSMIFGAHTPRVHPGILANSNLRTPRTPEHEPLLAQHLYEGGYSLDDRDLSRFLRESRRLRHGLETGQEFVKKHGLFGQQSVRMTGSSLANVSSYSSSVNRVHLADCSTSRSHFPEPNNLTTVMNRPMRRVTQYVTTPDRTTDGHSLQYSNLSSVQTSKKGVVSPAFLVCNEAAISVDDRGIQRRAGTILLAFGVLAYLPGGWMLIHSMGKGGPLATTAMAELTRVLEGGEECVVCCVHPMDAAMAQAIERAAVLLVSVGAVCWLAAVLWSATTF